jgi:hypothetical protein
LVAVAPPASAVTVNVNGCPAVTLDGAETTRTKGSSVTVALEVAPSSDAVIVAELVTGTTPVLIEKFSEVEPAGTVTVVWPDPPTLRRLGLYESATVRPAGGGALSVSVPIVLC